MKKKSDLKGKELYLTGIPGIDTQHKELIVLIDDFLKKIKEIPPPLSQFLEGASKLLAAHCATEESLIEMIGYPALEAHRSLHRELFTRLEDWRNNEAALGNAETLTVIGEFRAAIVTHIKTRDSEYADFIDNLMTLRKKFNITALKASTIAG